MNRGELQEPTVDSGPGPAGRPAGHHTAPLRTRVRTAMVGTALLIAALAGGCAAPVAGTAVLWDRPPPVAPATTEPNAGQAHTTPPTTESTGTTAAEPAWVPHPVGVELRERLEAVDRRNESFRVTVDVVDAVQEFRYGTLSLTRRDGEVERLEAMAGQGEFLEHLILLDGVFYYRSGTGRLFEKVTIDGGDEFRVTELTQLMEGTIELFAGTFPPLVALTTDGAGPTAEEIDGVATERFQVTLDLRAAQRSGFADEHPDMSWGLLAMRAAGISSAPLTIWLDSQDRPVRLEEHLVGDDIDETSRHSFRHFDGPVQITVPAPDRIRTG